MPEGRDADLLLLGRAVRRMREQQGMDIHDLAVTTGMPRDRIEALEVGDLDPTYELMLALAKGLGTKPSALATLAEQLKGSSEA
ncbi:MAG: helix-turn-helix domain-containing protein [Solirubrobacteraceae bacterium]